MGSSSIIMEAVPPWLEPLLTTTFFHICKRHGDAARSECNMFCLDCHFDAFCYYCRSSNHRDHHVIQIRRSSYHDVVRVGDVQKKLDISGVQTYTINSARVMFLNPRPQPKSSKGVSHLCESCGRSLLDHLRFCSLGCKLVAVKSNGNNTSFGIEKDDDEEGISITKRNNISLANKREKGALLHEDISPPTTPPHPSNSRRRKGIPHRAPLKS
ncbi:hypothetical protein RND81_01G033500 [Saponaria officinalis]|uniref:PLATZ transcription factor family protein n=1 Tax=Saponaria officinalis TaxID=3572 RepID=A0AAW1N8N2_SAPOF